MHSKKRYIQVLSQRIWTLSFILTLLSTLSIGCVVKEELDNTYNQAHLGLNQWSLLEQEDRSYKLVFDAGYLIGLSDSEGVSKIEWTYELITTNREIVSYTQEEMRDSSPEKDAIFVEGRRVRTVDIDTLLNPGDTYILWFTLKYRDDILHEQLFPLIAGEEGGNPNWIAELLGETFEDPEQALNMLPDDPNTMAIESAESDSLNAEDLPNVDEPPSADDPSNSGPAD